ncbi:PAS domain-containing sensor histidine kinase [Emcibacter sp.]|uniref:PAS domain-containing sensor histidine kinase n=1 Tax=Emcibacter sp. TaxID=1979954 RepID=UPI002AA8532A|nr:ATP-binding protein [Emcibacter sp.]
MKRQTGNSVFRGAGLFLTIYLATGLSADAAAVTLLPDNGYFIAAFIPFCLLAFIMLVWLVISRRKLNRRLKARERDYNDLARLLSSRQEVYIRIGARGHLNTSPGFAEWMGLKENILSLDGLREAIARISLPEFMRLRECSEQLVEQGKSFYLILKLKDGERRVVVHGELLDQAAGPGGGSIIWFRNLSEEENIAVHQQQEFARLSEELRFYQIVADQVTLPFWIRNEDLDLIWVNKAYVEAVEGESREQVLEDGLELVTSTLGQSAKDMAMMVEKAGEAQRDKHFVVIRGERRAMDIHNIPLYGDNGSRAFLGYAMDITELEEARGELIHHTESHSETLNKLSTAVAIFGLDKRLEYYNSAFVRLWHIPEERLFTHPHHAEVLEIMREARRLPEQANFPVWKQKQLSTYTELMEPIEEMWHLPDEATLRVVTQPHPQGGLLIFYEDVTDYLALERSYNTLFAVQQETLNNLHEAVAVFGIDGCLQLNNPGFAKMWGLSEDYLKESPHIMDVLEQGAENFRNMSQMETLRDLVVGGEGSRESGSGRLNFRNDTVIDYMSVSLPDGGVLVTFLDVTDSFRIENALRERNLALEATDKVKTEFLAHMSYELRNPLNSIIGFSELLEKEYQGPLNDDQHQYMRNILSASDHLLGLINDILDLAVIEAGGMTLEVSSFSLQGMLKEVLEDLEDNVRAKGLEVEFDCPDDIGLITGDGKRLHHTVHNLISNAVKFTPSPGFITIGAREENGSYRIFVKDTGVGIPAGEIEQIFEKFYTGSNVRNTQGAGLGLSLAKSFVEMHGGTMDVDSRLNMGTTVTCRLPKTVPDEINIKMVGE